MRVCVECRQRCVAREQEWAWSRILVDLLPFGVHVREWDRLSQLGQQGQMEQHGQQGQQGQMEQQGQLDQLGNCKLAKTLVHDAKQDTVALQQCASRFAARFRWLTGRASDSDSSCHQGHGPSCHQGQGPSFYRGTGSSLSLLDKALVAADTGTVHVLDAVHRTPKFLTLSGDAASAMLGNLAVHDALCVLQVPQPCGAVASCCGVSDSRGSDPRTRSPNSRGPNLVRAEFVSGLPLCAASNRKAIVGYMSPPQKMSAACVHGRIAIDALALSNPQAAAEMREKVGALLDTLAFVGRGRQVDGKRVQSCTLSSCNSLNSSKSLNASKSRNAQNTENRAQMKSDHAGSVFAGGAIRRMTKVEWLDFPQNRVASVACVPTARLLIWLECVDPRIVRASAFAAPEMYQSLFRSTILSDQATTEHATTEHATTEHETQPVLKPVLKSEARVETEKEKANKDQEAIVASIVLTVKQGTALDSYTTTHEFRDAYIGARDCGTGTKEIEPQKMQQVQMQQVQVQPVQAQQVQVATTYTNIAQCATPESMFVQSLLLTILQLQTGQFIDRANAKFLVDNTGTLLCYKAPLLPKTGEPKEPSNEEPSNEEPSNEEPSNEEPSHNANQEHQPRTETFALSADHRLKVRHAISTFISQHAANAAWLGLLLTSSSATSSSPTSSSATSSSATSSATSSSATLSATSSARPIRRIDADSPLIFVT
jgi:hypothetical protein